MTLRKPCYCGKHTNRICPGCGQYACASCLNMRCGICSNCACFFQPKKDIHYVYFFRAEVPMAWQDRTLYKIGRTTYSMHGRLAWLETGCPFELSADYCKKFAVKADADAYEAELHRRFIAYNTRGEWFLLPTAIVVALVESGEIIITEYTLPAKQEPTSIDTIIESAPKTPSPQVFLNNFQQSTHTVWKSDLLTMYAAWCRTTGNRRESNKAFGLALQKQFPDAIITNLTYGVSLKPDSIVERCG